MQVSEVSMEELNSAAILHLQEKRSRTATLVMIGGWRCGQRLK
jgi:hypothetical protein